MEATGKNNVLPLTYKGRPLMRKDATIYYGSMADKYIIMLQVLSDEQKEGYKLSGRVAVQLQYTDPEISSKDRVVKTAERDGLYDAMELASIWLERALSGKEPPCSQEDYRETSFPCPHLDLNCIFGSCYGSFCLCIRYSGRHRYDFFCREFPGRSHHRK